MLFLAALGLCQSALNARGLSEDCCQHPVGGQSARKKIPRLLNGSPNPCALLRHCRALNVSLAAFYRRPLFVFGPNRRTKLRSISVQLFWAGCPVYLGWAEGAGLRPWKGRVDVRANLICGVANRCDFVARVAMDPIREFLTRFAGSDASLDGRFVR